MHLPTTALLLSLLPNLSLALPHQERAANPTVTLSSGVLIGTTASIANQPSATGRANAYLGIPYAASPPLRFAPPSPAPAWSTPLLAQTNAPACIQQFLPGGLGQRERTYFNNPGLPAPEESEDCLYLNVFAPQAAGPSADAAALKPVLFWIFGGNLQFGTAGLAYYDGTSFAVREDVVVVVINYRTNIFGFSGSPEIPFGQQNAGFLDQRLALKWVQDNIAQFGGDPARVTIFGESAGGFGVKQLLANPPSPLPFHAAILESQQALTVGNGTSDFGTVAAHFNCSSAPSPLACLRQVSATEIQSYVNDNAVQFPPAVHDGTNLGGNTLPSIQSGQFAPVPVLIGTNRDEFSVFLEIIGLGTDLPVVGDITSALGLNISGITDLLVGLYAGTIGEEDSALATRILTDLFFTCPAQSLASGIASAGRQPVWRYRYDATFPNLAIFPDSGAFHTSEIPSVWGTYPLDNQFGNVTQTQIELSSFMQGVWAGFARDPTAGPGWPKLGSNAGVELGVLGGTGKPDGEQTVNLAEADSPCLLLDPVLQLMGWAF